MNRRDAIKLLSGTPAAAALDKLPEVEKVERLRATEGDTIVLTLGDHTFMSSSEEARITRQLSKAFAPHRVLVLMPNMKLSIVGGVVGRAVLESDV